MARYRTADEIREKANERLRQQLAKANAVERKENEKLGRELRTLAKELEKTPEEIFQWAKSEFLSTSQSEQPENIMELLQ